MDILFANADTMNLTKMMRVITVLAVVHLDPHISTRQIERKIGIP